jgi:Protein of unknown function (DUF3040)
MSTRDEATLSAAERAALAGLESKAEADDPRLAAQLRGGGHARPTLQVPPGLVRASQTWAGPVVAVAGLALMVLALSSAVIIALVGALLFMGGLLMSSSLVRHGLGATVHVLPGRQTHDQDHGEGLTNA